MSLINRIPLVINMLAGLIAYCLKENKPNLDLNAEEIEIMESTNFVVA